MTEEKKNPAEDWPPQEPCESPEPVVPGRAAAEPPPLPPMQHGPRRWIAGIPPHLRRRVFIAAVGVVLAVACVVVYLTTRPSKLKSLHDLARFYGRRRDLDPALILAVVQAESSGRPKAVSRSNARGLMQLMWPTALDMAKKEKLELAGPEALFDPALNVRLGTRYLALMRRMFDDDPFLYLAAYNCGPGRMSRLRKANPKMASWELVALEAPSETRVYVRRVMRYWDGFRKELAAEGTADAKGTAHLRSSRR